MSPQDRLRWHARIVEEMAAECRALPPAAACTRRGLLRKLGFEAAAHARLAAEAGDTAAAGWWRGLAGHLERAWSDDLPAVPQLAHLESALAKSTAAGASGGGARAAA